MFTNSKRSYPNPRIHIPNLTMEPPEKKRRVWKPDSDKPFWPQMLEYTQIQVTPTLPLRCGAQCEDNYPEKSMGTLKPSTEPLLTRTAQGCSHVWHPTCLKFMWFNRNLSSWGSSYTLRENFD
jgi:hypothetical protein